MTRIRITQSMGIVPDDCRQQRPTVTVYVEKVIVFYSSIGIQFACTDTSNTAALLSDPATGTLQGANIAVIENDISQICVINVDQHPDADLRIYIESLTEAELQACRQDVIEYALEFIALNPEVPIGDTCTPNL